MLKKYAESFIKAVTVQPSEPLVPEDELRSYLITEVLHKAFVMHNSAANFGNGVRPILDHEDAYEQNMADRLLPEVIEAKNFLRKLGYRYDAIFGQLNTGGRLTPEQRALMFDSDVNSRIAGKAVLTCVDIEILKQSPAVMAGVAAPTASGLGFVSH